MQIIYKWCSARLWVPRLVHQVHIAEVWVQKSGLGSHCSPIATTMPRNDSSALRKRPISADDSLAPSNLLTVCETSATSHPSASHLPADPLTRSPLHFRGRSFNTGPLDPIYIQEALDTYRQTLTSITFLPCKEHRAFCAANLRAQDFMVLLVHSPCRWAPTCTSFFVTEESGSSV